MKQTATDWMFDQLWETPKDKLAWFKILMDAKEMEKEQMHDTWVDSRTFDKGDNYFGKQKSFDEYYNETYGDK
jgi:hypothetical protein